MARATAVPVSGPQLDNRRVLAALIDLVIVGIGWAVILAAAGKVGDSASGAGGALTAVGLGWALYYYFACETGSGQTLGKRAMKIRVVRTDGAPAGMREIGLRTVLRVVDGLFVYLVGLIVMLATGERRGRLGDLVGGTMVVSADKPAHTAVMSAPELPAAALRAPSAESGPAFAPVVPDEPDAASPSLTELGSDVTAVTDDPERDVEDEEPEVEELPAAQVEDEPVVEQQPVAEAELEDPAGDADQSESDPEVTVKSVETVAAIDLVMEDAEAVAGGQSKAQTD